MRNGAWSKTEDEALAFLLLGTNETLDDIAAFLERSPTSVFKRVRIVLSKIDSYWNVTPKDKVSYQKFLTKYYANKGHSNKGLQIGLPQKRRLPGTPPTPRIGFREHLGFTVRSSWENNVALWFKHCKKPFEYEPKLFVFEGETRGAKSFLPDFYLPKEDIWIEVKGHFKSADRTKMRRLKKYHPEIFARMRFIVAKEGCPADLYYKKIGLKPYAYYDELFKKFKGKIEHWESPDNNYGRG